MSRDRNFASRLCQIHLRLCRMPVIIAAKKWRQVQDEDDPFGWSREQTREKRAATAWYTGHVMVVQVGGGPFLVAIHSEQLVQERKKKEPASCRWTVQSYSSN